MNEHIQRIAESTNFTIAHSPIWQLKVEEFSQALVKECARFMDEHADRTGCDLLEHFGVE
jgi:hypothetical protein